MHLLRYVCCLLSLWLGACTATYAPVIDKYGTDTAPAKPVTQGVHVVRSGETLYSIAWRYGWDFRRLAAANGIRSPYTIYPGQEIRLDRQPPSTSAVTPKAPSPSAPSASVTPAPTPSKPSVPAAKPAPSSGPISWQWPAPGKVLAGYEAGKAGRQGISIDGNTGDAVAAAGNGVVVYRGNGLTGYGNLLIIKHDERWLSAYAHNQRMLVSEGQAVKAGEKIATMGDSGTYRTQLHFEVRRDGTPIDPLAVLPKR